MKTTNLLKLTPHAESGMTGPLYLNACCIACISYAPGEIGTLIVMSDGERFLVAGTPQSVVAQLEGILSRGDE